MLFLYTIILLFGDIENNLNKIWQVPKGRSIARKVTDYSAFILLMPIFFCSCQYLEYHQLSSKQYVEDYLYIVSCYTPPPAEYCTLCFNHSSDYCTLQIFAEYKSEIY